MKIPIRLRSGDKIGVITPSAPVFASPSPEPMRELERGLAFLTDLGFEVTLGKHALKGYGYLAGSAQDRASDINAMFADPEIRAIISTHGGSNANSCLPHLDGKAIRENPKILMGFSDLTVLLLAVYARSGLVTFHGNMVMWHFGMNPTDYDRDEFLDRLVHGRIGRVRKNSEWATIRGRGRVEGRLIGGHLGQMSFLIGTPYWPDLSEAILFLEFPTVFPELLDARFHQLRQMGVFDKVRGVVVGHTDVPPEDPKHMPEFLLHKITFDLGFPIVKCDDFGHHCPNTVLPIGVRARLDTDNAELEILEACVQ